MRKLKILFLAANPAGSAPLALGEEVRDMEFNILKSSDRDSITLISQWALRASDLQFHLLRHRPQIVHFSGHGSPYDEIILEDHQGQAKPVKGEALTSLFETHQGSIRLVFLNACFSRSQAEAISEHVDFTIGMKKEVGDRAAITFARAFYRALAFGSSIQNAFDQGITELRLERIPEDRTPELLVRTGLNPSLVVLSGQESAPAPDGSSDPSSPKRRPRLVCSYAAEDRDLVKSLGKHLKMLQRHGYLDTWTDMEIVPGGDMNREISENFEKADIILLLISVDYLGSDYHYDVEMKRAMQLHENGQARVIPVFLRKADMTGSPFLRLAGLPGNGVPVTDWTNRDEAWTDVARGIRRVVEHLRSADSD